MSSGQSWWADKEREEEADKLATDTAAVELALAPLTSDQLDLMAKKIVGKLAERLADNVRTIELERLRKQFGL